MHLKRESRNNRLGFHNRETLGARALSGKQVVFVNSLFTTHIEGLPPAESAAILNFLFEHITRDEYTCRFHWRPHSIAIWDNRSTQHKPINDYFPARRLMHRITIDGDKPY